MSDDQGIVLRNVSKAFGSTRVLDDLSLQIGVDEFVVFLGPSGCGKSTLLRVIAGLESIDAGEIWIGGERVDSLPPAARSIAMVFQHYALYPHMTVRQNMEFGLRNLGTPKDQIALRVQDAARMLEIEALLERKPTQISGGQRQRVAIGRAIVKQPRAFLFDEPLSNLDAALRARTRLEIAQLHERIRTAMIFVTHDQVEAMTLAQRIVVMNNSRIEQVGTPMDIYERPASLFVAGFVGTPAMNILAVEARIGGAAATVQLADGTRVATCIASAQLQAGQHYKMGVRAENIKVVPVAGASLRGTVKFLERLGDRTLLHVRLTGESTLITQVEGLSRIAVGDTVGLMIDPAAVHLFDAQCAYHAAVQAAPELRVATGER